MSKGLFLPVVVLLLMSGCTSIDGIPILGLDKNGFPTQLLLSKDKFANILSGTAGSVQDSTLFALEGRRSGRTAWNLRTLAVGIGLNAEVGIGPAKLGVYPCVRLIFANAKQAILP